MAGKHEIVLTKDASLARIQAAEASIEEAQGDAAALAKIANRAYRDAEHFTLEKLVESGSALLDAKECVPHGAWKAWLAERWEQSPRQAQVLMQIANHWRGLTSKTQRSAFLALGSIQRALEAIPPAKPANPSPKPSTSPPPRVIDIHDAEVRDAGPVPKRGRCSRCSADVAFMSDGTGRLQAHRTDGRMCVGSIEEPAPPPPPPSPPAGPQLPAVRDQDDDAAMPDVQGPPGAAADDDQDDEDDEEEDFPVDPNGDLLRAKDEGWCGCKHAFVEHGGRIAATGHLYYVDGPRTACKVADCGCRSFHYAPAAAAPADEPPECEACGQAHDYADCPTNPANDVGPDDDYVDPDPVELARAALERDPCDTHAIEQIVYERGMVAPLALPAQRELATHEQHSLCMLRNVHDQLAFKLQHRQHVSGETRRLLRTAEQRVADALVVLEEAARRSVAIRAERTGAAAGRAS